MAMIGAALRQPRVLNAVTGEELSPPNSTQGLGLVGQAAVPVPAMAGGQPPVMMPPPPQQSSPVFSGALHDALQQALTSGAPSSLPDAAPITVGNTHIALPPAAPHKKFFTSDGTGTGNLIMGILGDALAGAAGHEGTYGPMMERRRQEQTAFERGEQMYQLRRRDELADRDHDETKAQYFSGNEDRVMYDPASGNTRTLYDAPTAPQAYATTLGYAPGTPAYTNAIKDYVLRANGPSAYDVRDALQTSRYGLMGDLQAPRIAASIRNTDARTNASISNNMRTTATNQRNTTVRDATARRGQDMTDARTRGSAGYQGLGRGRGFGGGGAQAVATSPDGHKIVLKGNRWVDAVTGQPVQ